MSRLLNMNIRQAARVAMIGLGSGACITTTLRAQPIRLDSAGLQTSAPPSQRVPAVRSRISAEAVQQFSSGSVAGFCTGVVVALFSRTLVFLGTLFALSVYVASRYSIDLPRMLGVKQLKLPAWWRKIEQSPYFTGSFALTFALAAFVRL